MGRLTGKGIYARETAILIDLRSIGHGRLTLQIPPTPPNLKYAARLRHEILQKHELGALHLAEYFPESQAAAEATGPTFGAWCTEWLALIAPDVEATTLQEYRNCLRGYFYPLWGDKLIASLTQEDIETGLASLTRISGKTFNNLGIPLRRALRKAFEYGKTKIDLGQFVGRRRVQKPGPDPLTLEEVEAVLTVLTERHGPQVANYFEFAFFAGLRPSELIALQWGDVDLRHGVVRVERARVRYQDKDTKTHVGRDVELNMRARAALERQKAHTFLAGGHVFHNPLTGEPYADTDYQVQRFWRPALKACGLRDRDARQTRHTCATLMLMADCKPAWAASQLGHSVEMFLQTYARWVHRADKRRETGKMDQFVGAATGSTAMKRH